MRTTSPTVSERVIGPDTASYGRLAPGVLRDVRDNGMIDMQISPNGDMVLVPQSGHLLYHVKATPHGRIDGDSPVVAVLGTGPGGGGLMAGLRAVSAQSLTPGSLKLDDQGLIMTIGGSSAVRLLLDF